jgi:hypothetical protein
MVSSTVELDLDPVSRRQKPRLQQMPSVASPATTGTALAGKRFFEVLGHKISADFYDINKFVLSPEIACSDACYRKTTHRDGHLPTSPNSGAACC